MVHRLASSHGRPASPNHALYKAALTTPLPTRDDILSLLLHPSTTPSDLHAITALLQSASCVTRLRSFRLLQLSDTTPRHCVRCHASYTDARNTHGACVVPHMFNLHNNAAGCCRRPVSHTMIEDVGSQGACYRGYHTEDVNEVEAEGGYNGINIRRCDDEGGVCNELFKPRPM